VSTDSPVADVVDVTFVVQVRFKHPSGSGWSHWTDRDFHGAEDCGEEHARESLAAWREGRKKRPDMEFRLVRRTQEVLPD
jgi:hypothetical protein